MDFKQLEFSTFMIGCVAMRLKQPCSKVYRMMKEKNVINDFIVGCYDSLHTFSREYATDEVIKYMKHKGVII